MAAPTFVAAYNATWDDVGPSPFYEKTVSVTTQAGDVVVVYAIAESTSLAFNEPAGNGITFTENEAVFAGGFCPITVWSGVDATGGTNWTLEVSGDSGFYTWGFACVVFRSSTGVGVSEQANASGGSASVDLTTTADDSAVLTVQGDWQATDGSSRTWRTVNSITPTSGNGLETTYELISGKYTAYGAYYTNVGAIGQDTYGVSSPTQDYSVIAIEIKGTATNAPTVTTSPVTNITATTATGNGEVVSDGGLTITERGVCWHTSPNPTTSNSTATTSGTTGTYNVSITGLTNNVLYYARAYAINSQGTSYGNQVTFFHNVAYVSWLTA